MSSDHIKVLTFTETLVTLLQVNSDCFDKKFCNRSNLLEMFLVMLRKFFSKKFLIIKKY